jgi:hypothetical protein
LPQERLREREFDSLCAQLDKILKRMKPNILKNNSSLVMEPCVWKILLSYDKIKQEVRAFYIDAGTSVE